MWMASFHQSLEVFLWSFEVLGKCQIPYHYLQKASCRIWPPLKYVISVFILSSEIFVVICTKVFQICTCMCIFHICHSVTWQLHSNQNNEQFIINSIHQHPPHPCPLMTNLRYNKGFKYSRNVNSLHIYKITCSFFWTWPISHCHNKSPYCQNKIMLTVVRNVLIANFIRNNCYLT